MLKLFFGLFFFLLGKGIHAQSSSYIYFELDTTSSYELFYVNEQQKEIIESVEDNLYSFDPEQIFVMEIEGKQVKFDLRKYRKDKFFVIKIEQIDKSKEVEYRYKKGDVIRIENSCLEESCIKILVEFPVIIECNGEYTTTINSIFSRYIFPTQRRD